jgi:hypothetical protein
MPIRRSLALLTALLAVAALFAALPAAPALAKGNGCHGLHLSVSKHHVQAGGWVRVRGRVCRDQVAPKQVRIAMRGRHGWRLAVRARVRHSGKFTRRVHLSRANRVGVVHLRALQRSRRSNAVAVHIGGATAVAAPASGCGLTGQPGEVVEMTMPGCPVIASDTSAEASPLSFWGAIECESATRYSYGTSGGDAHLTATGAAQPDTAFRELSTVDGDDTWGERCELGKNDNRTGPTVFYHEGQHRVTYISLRLPSNFPLGANTWQTVMQMKQTQPSDDNCCGPELELEARTGHWYVADSWKGLFEFPAQTNTWTRFAWDVFYSQDPSKGWIQVSADLNGDGDFNDPGERSPLVHTATLRTEPEGPHGASDGLPAGAPIPSHLRTGIYHNPSIPCPAPGGCSVDVDNVQVLGS